MSFVNTARCVGVVEGHCVTVRGGDQIVYVGPLSKRSQVSDGLTDCIVYLNPKDFDRLALYVNSRRH